MAEYIFGSLATIENRISYLQTKSSGVRHDYRMTPRTPRTGESPVITVTVETAVSIKRVICELVLPETAVLEFHQVSTEWDLLNWTYYQVWQATLPSQADGTLVRYRIFALPVHGDPIPADDGDDFSYLVGEAAQPAWAESAVVYQIFPDRFHPGNGRTWNPTQGDLNAIYGGTLRGIIDQLDYIADLGFNCLWLNPFFPDHTHHGYHATDYFAVNPRLGTMDDIRELVAKAHAKGIRLLLDFVANHWGSGHETFQAALKDPNSEYYNWYNWIDYPHDYHSFFGVKDLPQVNVANPGVRDYLLRSVKFWLGDVGFDGLRLDYVLGPTHDFWTELRQVAKQLKPDAWLFGEAVETPTTLLTYEGRFDGCLDFLLAQAFRKLFGNNGLTLEAFDTLLAQHEQYFPRQFSLPSFLDNHDMNRFLWVVNGDKNKLKLAALCQFTLRGAPIVYNGTEIGLSQLHDMRDPQGYGMAECRLPMTWGDDQDQDLYNYYKWLVHFRLEHPVLWRGTRQTIHLDAATGTFAYVCQDENEVVLVGLNLSDEKRPFSVTLPSSQQHTFHLPPWSGDVVVFPA